MKPTDLYQGSTGEKRSRDLFIFVRVAIVLAMLAFLCAAFDAWAEWSPPESLPVGCTDHGGLVICDDYRWYYAHGVTPPGHPPAILGMTTTSSFQSVSNCPMGWVCSGNVMQMQPEPKPTEQELRDAAMLRELRAMRNDVRRLESLLKAERNSGHQ